MSIALFLSNAPCWPLSYLIRMLKELNDHIIPLYLPLTFTLRLIGAKDSIRQSNTNMM